MELSAIVHALDAGRLELGSGQGRQEHRGQNGNDGDDDQEFNQRKGATPRGIDMRTEAPMWIHKFN